MNFNEFHENFTAFYKLQCVQNNEFFLFDYFLKNFKMPFVFGYPT